MGSGQATGPPPTSGTMTDSSQPTASSTPDGPTSPRRDPGGSPWTARLFLVLALAGAVWPWLANWDFIREYGAFDINLFLGLANENAAAQSLFRDLSIGATAVTIWMVMESRRLSVRGIGWVLLSCLTIAFAFGAPLFLSLIHI